MIRLQLCSHIPGTSVHVGWNDELRTFFAHVRQVGRFCTDEPKTILTLGNEHNECLNIIELQARIQLWASLPVGTAKLLERHRDTVDVPTARSTQPLIMACPTSAHQL